jgi:hypothetical protein
VRLDESFRGCAVVIGTGTIGTEDEISTWGTAFLVGETKIKMAYLVTAAHVVADKVELPFEVRFNVKGAGAKNHTIEYPDWVFHPTDNTVDVAVHLIEVPAWADVTLMPKTPNLAMENRLESKNIGAGNRTYTVGLWKFLHGKRRNQNYVYTGHIGLIPDNEKIRVDPWLPEHGNQRVGVEAYLIEGEPLDGASGSPVFVRRTLPFSLPQGIGKKALQAYAEGSLWLLGLQSDAYVGTPGEDYEIPRSGDRVIVPRGVNVVVPVEKIIEVLDHPKLKDAREKAMEEMEASKTPVKTGRKPSNSAEPAPDDRQHKERFTALLNAAAKKKPQDV